MYVATLSGECVVKPAIPDLQTTLAITGSQLFCDFRSPRSPVSLNATASRDLPRGATQELHNPLSAVHTWPSSKRHLSQNVSFWAKHSITTTCKPKLRWQRQVHITH